MARVRLVLAAMVALALTMLGAPELVNAEPAPGGEAAADSTAGPAPVSERRDLAKELVGPAEVRCGLSGEARNADSDPSKPSV